MIDATPGNQLYVSNEGTAGPYIRVPVSRLDDLCRLLDKNRIRYWVEENAISLDGGPEIAVVDLGHDAEVATVQGILGGLR